MRDIVVSAPPTGPAAEPCDSTICATLAVIEQTDDADFLARSTAAFEDVIELDQMRSEIRGTYRNNQEVLVIFPVAAYNGGPRNVAKLYGVMRKLGVKPNENRWYVEKYQTALRLFQR